MIINQCILDLIKSASWEKHHQLPFLSKKTLGKIQGWHAKWCHRRRNAVFLPSRAYAPTLSTTGFALRSVQTHISMRSNGGFISQLSYSSPNMKSSPIKAHFVADCYMVIGSLLHVLKQTKREKSNASITYLLGSAISITGRKTKKRSRSSTSSQHHSKRVNHHFANRGTLTW